eukprot:XP_001703436.1 hypothetical protein CHLREDRAFT_143849 [Chlamydomonas reinhardtii]
MRPALTLTQEQPSSAQLTPAHLRSYYPLNLALLPEAARGSAGAFYTPRDPGHERRGGCKALQQEMEATGRASILYRPIMAALNGAVAAGQQPRLLLTGPAGCGKSLALLGLVEWARQQGWLVVYVPSCLALVRGGYFARRGRGAAGGWDTLTSAQQLLKGVMDAHGPLLQSLPVLPVPGRAARRQQQQQHEPRQADKPAKVEEGQGQGQGQAGGSGLLEEGSGSASGAGGGGGRTLQDVALRGLSSDDNAQLAVDSALQLIRQLQLLGSGAAQPPDSQPGQPPRVLFALDDYNYLYGPTDYGVQPPSASPLQGRRRVLDAGELILARGLRLLESELGTNPVAAAAAGGGAGGVGGAVVVAATTATPALPAPRSLALEVPHTVVEVPGFDEAETAAALAHYAATGAATRAASAAEARHLFALTGGNGRELRAKAGALGVRVG